MSDTQETSNHNWTIPVVGRANDEWGQILNDFFDNELDAQVILEGLHSERPSAGVDSVKYYHSTDRNIIYYNDGSEWNQLAGTGSGAEALEEIVVEGGSFVDLIVENNQEYLTTNGQEPDTPSGDKIVLWNNGNSLNAKFSDGSTVTIAEE